MDCRNPEFPDPDLLPDKISDHFIPDPKPGNFPEAARNRNGQRGILPGRGPLEEDAMDYIPAPDDAGGIGGRSHGNDSRTG